MASMDKKPGNRIMTISHFMVKARFALTIARDRDDPASPWLPLRKRSVPRTGLFGIVSSFGYD
jgi:hypothetical protein